MSYPNTRIPKTGQEISQWPEPWPFILPIAQGLFTVNPLLDSNTAKLATWHTKIRRSGDVPDGAILVRFLPIRAVIG